MRASIRSRSPSAARPSARDSAANGGRGPGVRQHWRAWIAARIALRSASPAASGATIAWAASRVRVAAHDRVGQHVVGLDREGLAGLVLVEDDEAGRHVRLEGEHVQQPLAEGVQGLDLEAARRLDRAGEEAAGRLQALARGPLAGEPDQLRRERPSSRVTQRPRRWKRGSTCWRPPPW